MFNSIAKYRELLLILVARNIKIRYKNSILGFFWTLLSPIFLILIYAVFLGLLKVPIPHPVLVTGIIVWQFLAMCLGDSLHAIVGNANLVTKTAFPRIVLPLAMVIANLVNFLLSCTVLLVFLLLAKVTFGPIWLLPLVLMTQFALCLGMALLLATANVFFRDTEHILSILMLAWFFMSPVIYQVTLVTEKFGQGISSLFFLNPMTGIVLGYRAALLSTEIPSTWMLAGSFLVSWIVLAIGIAVFNKCEPMFGDEL